MFVISHVLKLAVKTPFNRQDEVIEILESLLEPTRACQGLMSAGIFREVHGDGVLLLEEWTSKDDMVRHIQSPDFRKVLAVMDMAIEPPDLGIHRVASTRGFELIEKLYESIPD